MNSTQAAALAHIVSQNGATPAHIAASQQIAVSAATSALNQLLTNGLVRIRRFGAQVWYLPTATGRTGRA
jgi:DNA-binding MarR family transcriptional regulator